jgi:hypothetical protein
LSQVEDLAKQLDEICVGFNMHDLANNDWNTFFEKYMSLDEKMNLPMRLAILNHVQSITEKSSFFSKLSTENRYLIGGFHVQKYMDSTGLDAGTFGSMKGAGKFTNLLKNQPKVLDETIALIINTKIINKEVYIKIVDCYKKALNDAEVGKNLLKPLTRLLALLKPEQFLCITSRNETMLCKYFGIRKFKADEYQRYFDDIIQPIRNMKWNNILIESTDKSKKVFGYRMALLDMLFYQNPTTQKIIDKSRLKRIGSKSASLNREEAKNIMSVYYKDNKTTLPKNISVYREDIIEHILDGLVVEEAFLEALI